MEGASRVGFTAGRAPASSPDPAGSSADVGAAGSAVAGAIAATGQDAL